MLDLGVVVDHLAIAADIDEVVRMQAIVPRLMGGDVDLGVAIAQREDHARLQPELRIGRDDGMHAVGHVAGLPVGLDVVQQVHAEVVQAQVGDRDAGLEVFKLDDFFLQAPQLFLAVGHVIGLRAEDVVVPGCGDVGDHHPVFDAFLEVDVFVERDVGPVVDELDAGVRRADAVHAAKPLNDAHWVPVNVVVDQIVAVLQVLAFGDTVGADQQVNFLGFIG